MTRTLAMKIKTGGFIYRQNNIFTALLGYVHNNTRGGCFLVATI